MSDVGDVQRAITRGAVALWSSRFGKGPDLARTYLNDENVVIVMHGGLHPHEQLLVDAGEEQAVRALRHRFEQLLRPDMKRLVEEATGRPVLTFDSITLFGPTRTFELFVLGEPVT